MKWLMTNIRVLYTLFSTRMNGEEKSVSVVNFVDVTRTTANLYPS